jgi:hypothetical protein
MFRPTCRPSSGVTDKITTKDQLLIKIITLKKELVATGGYLLNIGLYAQQDAEPKNKILQIDN